MSSVDILSMCLRNLVKRKLRTSLTILGVMIGTASIVIMVSLGLAVNQRFAQEMENMSDVTVISVYDYNYYSRNRGSGVMVMGETQQPETAVLDDNMMQSFENMPGVVVATPIAQVNLYFKSGKYIMDNWYVMGLKAEAMQLLGYEAETGRLLQEGDDQYNVVFGYLAEKQFGPSGEAYWRNNRFYDAMSGIETDTLVDVTQDKITMSFDSNYLWGYQNNAQEYDVDDMNAPKPIKPVNINVVGVLANKENDYQANGGIFMDIDIVKKLQLDAEKAQRANNQDSGGYSAIQTGQDYGYQQAFVKCKDMDVTGEICEKIRAMGFDASYPGDWLATLQSTAQMLQMLLAAIGGVSLFVAAIGIANTMIMSIYERTREIGVMKVIGAAIRDIKWIFLLESAMLGVFGGTFGLGLSFLVSYILNNAGINFFGVMTESIGPGEGAAAAVSLITPWLCGLALTFSAGVGLLSGYFPARRAMRLSALTAIKTE